MAVPSSVSLGSLAFIVAAGVGFVAITAYADDSSPARHIAPKSGNPALRGAGSGSGDGTTRRPPEQARHRARPEVVPNVLVEVYNNSGIGGLAATKAGVLEGAGWNVAATDNWYGNIPASTVYHPDKLRRQARQLAAVLDVHRLRPAVSPMRFDRLTVIVTSP